MKAKIIFKGFKLNVLILTDFSLRSGKVVISLFNMKQKGVRIQQNSVIINEEKRSLVTVQ